MTRTAEPRDIASELFDAYAAGNRERVRGVLADDLVAYVTNAHAGVDEVRGADEYVSRLPDLAAAGGAVRVTQMLQVDRSRVLTMVEIRAEHDRRDLHNFAAFLAEVADGRVAKLWMVDALPAYSAEFWA